MSGDEADYVNGECRYVIVNPIWRSSLVTPFLRLFDKVHLSTRYTSLNRPKRGAFPHHRYPSKRVDHSSKAVPGLPSNFYCKDWLANLEKFQVDALQIQPEYNLSVSRSVLRCVKSHIYHMYRHDINPRTIFRLAERFKNVIDRTMRPLDVNDPSLPPLNESEVPAQASVRQSKSGGKRGKRLRRKGLGRK
jgi:hypothetical protein